MKLTDNQAKTIAAAARMLEKAFKQEAMQTLDSADTTKALCKFKIGHEEREIFAVLFLDSQHQLIEFTEMFQGTLNKCPVFCRDIAKKALLLNAAAVILTHNHPSGIVSPSQADKDITEQLYKALRLFDIKVLDHIIVNGNAAYSFAEKGLL